MVILKIFLDLLNILIKKNIFFFILLFTGLTTIFSFPKKDTTPNKSTTETQLQTIRIIDTNIIENEFSFINNMAARLKQQIVNMPDTLSNSSGITFYVSSINGNDRNNGLSPGRALKTPSLATEKANNSRKSCTILFERGSVFRGNFRIWPRKNEHYSYGAYGTGPKPEFYGSLLNYASSSWNSNTASPNLWICNTEISNDPGIIVFNEGENVGIKKFNLSELKTNFDFYYDRSLKRVYLYCTNNPANFFNSIEIGQAWVDVKEWGSSSVNDKLLSIIAIPDSSSNITIENLSIKYGGAHGIAGQDLSNVTIRGCEFNWIGGGIYEEDFSDNVRYGNGIEFWNSCENIIVENCYFNQIYDAALTHQGDRISNISNNVTYKNNLMEYCNYSIEYFQRQADALMSNILIEGNIMRFAGYGWGYQRPDKGHDAHIKSWAHYNRSSNFIIRNNILDTARTQLFDIRLNLSLSGTSLPVLSKNIYSQTINGLCGTWGSNRRNRETIIQFTQEDLEIIDTDPTILTSYFDFK